MSKPSPCSCTHEHFPSDVPSMIVCQIVDRLHVSEPYANVVRELRSKLTKKARRDHGSRAARHVTYRQGLEQHRRNRSLYAWVQYGCMGQSTAQGS